MTKTFDKLVRDKIPQIIQDSGRQAKTKILDDREYLDAIDRKLDEELAEYHENPCLEELADLVEVIHAAVEARGYSIQELERLRLAKKDERGGFEKRVLLEKVIG